MAKAIRMSDDQEAVLRTLRTKDVKILSDEMIGDVLVVKLAPNLLCVVEKNGSMSTSTFKKGAGSA